LKRELIVTALAAWLGACAAPPGGAQSTADCRASCPEGSEWADGACRYPAASVQCPPGSRFQGRACVPTERVAEVNVQRLIDGTTIGKSKKSVLMEDFKEKQKKLDQVQERLLEEKKELDSGKLSEAAKKLRREKYEKELAELGMTYQRFQEEIRVKERALTSEILSEVRDAASRLGEQQGFSAVYFEEGVLWTKPGKEQAAEALRGMPRFDLTAAVMDEMNRAR
jgi:Skp family chaperone for outer membrane proteins